MMALICDFLPRLSITFLQKTINHFVMFDVLKSVKFSAMRTLVELL